MAIDSIRMVPAIYGFAEQIYAQVEQAKANKSQCQYLAERVGIVETALRGIDLKQKNYSSSLQALVKLFEDRLVFIKKFSK